ncbi:hypothetical protein CAPTEDRAFT_189716 [Capitella teleta]|uniref:HSF-type DNA-binding domain-containing protein n=1 Tax=Capitella teleta TaxID=283909 RepID=R7TI58_CAPTE|nr:hypothetical protein CAPTEDRAFT_189716 [Capitella teleta]|eukprot:ELT90765.1 hypothetical protein CAPTEDRAFT_189716 [Capitella teleta]
MSHKFDREHTFPWKLWYMYSDSKVYYRYEYITLAPTIMLSCSTDKSGDVYATQGVSHFSYIFERDVLTVHPDLLQVKSFSNFRRQLRVYGFEWHLNAKMQFVFKHPMFNRDRPTDAGLIVSMFAGHGAKKVRKSAQKQRRLRAKTKREPEKEYLNVMPSADWLGTTRLRHLSGGGRILNTDHLQSNDLAYMPPLPAYHVTDLQPPSYAQPIQASSADFVEWRGDYVGYHVMQAIPSYSAIP